MYEQSFLWSLQLKLLPNLGFRRSAHFGQQKGHKHCLGAHVLQQLSTWRLIHDSSSATVRAWLSSRTDRANCSNHTKHRHGISRRLANSGLALSRNVPSVSLFTSRYLRALALRKRATNPVFVSQFVSLSCCHRLTYVLRNQKLGIRAYTARSVASETRRALANAAP